MKSNDFYKPTRKLQSTELWLACRISETMLVSYRLTEAIFKTKKSEAF
jgi:hypothetical protein